ncbi:ejaculatory bulb-specific protein 3-like [Schistocerca americana]|uniref:ejaculatory bulb-specific protein 3-like n=1 Tax=Schistocerca americana TaxID=7009 RepID=UPI001F4F43BC|nr:ejaculatory bulb-specific protein 3-like [Schistocerca americana]XP_049831176.1 ejaculatory bulb-specific protein 3-like [Schistocerca gregaria]
MRVLVLFLWLAAACAAAGVGSGLEPTAEQIDALLSNKRLVSRYVQCLLGRKRCPPEGTELKRILPEAIATRCARCTTVQKAAAIRVIRRLRADYPAEWAELQAHWDPTGVHLKSFERALLRRRPDRRLLHA